MAHLFSAILLLVLGSEWIFLLAAADSSGQLLLDLYDTKAVIGKLFEYEIGTDDFRQTYQIFQVKDAQNNELPNWLYYNTSSNELNGVPLSEDLGRVFIEVVAHCILESYLCKDLSEIFLIEIVNSESSTGINLISQHALGNKIDLLQNSGENKAQNDLFATNSLCHDNNLISATLVLHVVHKKWFGKLRVILLHNMAQFLSIEITKLILTLPFQNLQKITVLAAGPGNTVASLKDSVELSWHVTCRINSQLYDFIQVLQHNIDSERIKMELGYSVISWYISTTEMNLKHLDYGRKRRHVAMITSFQTPTVFPPPPVLSTEVMSSAMEITRSVPPTRPTISTEVSKLLMTYQTGIYSDRIENSKASTLVHHLSKTSTSEFFKSTLFTGLTIYDENEIFTSIPLSTFSACSSVKDWELTSYFPSRSMTSLSSSFFPIFISFTSWQREILSTLDLVSPITSKLTYTGLKTDTLSLSIQTSPFLFSNFPSTEFEEVGIQSSIVSKGSLQHRLSPTFLELSVTLSSTSPYLSLPKQFSSSVVEFKTSYQLSAPSSSLSILYSEFFSSKKSTIEYISNSFSQPTSLNTFDTLEILYSTSFSSILRNMSVISISSSVSQFALDSEVSSAMEKHFNDMATSIADLSATYIVSNKSSIISEILISESHHFTSIIIYTYPSIGYGISSIFIPYSSKSFMSIFVSTLASKKISATSFYISETVPSTAPVFFESTRLSSEQSDYTYPYIQPSSSSVYQSKTTSYLSSISHLPILISESLLLSVSKIILQKTVLTSSTVFLSTKDKSASEYFVPSLLSCKLESPSVWPSATFGSNHLFPLFMSSLFSSLLPLSSTASEFYSVPEVRSVSFMEFSNTITEVQNFSSVEMTYSSLSIVVPTSTYSFLSNLVTGIVSSQIMDLLSSMIHSPLPDDILFSTFCSSPVFREFVTLSPSMSSLSVILPSSVSDATNSMTTVSVQTSQTVSVPTMSDTMHLPVVSPSPSIKTVVISSSGDNNSPTQSPLNPAISAIMSVNETPYLLYSSFSLDIQPVISELLSKETTPISAHMPFLSSSAKIETLAVSSSESAYLPIVSPDSSTGRATVPFISESTHQFFPIFSVTTQSSLLSATTYEIPSSTDTTLLLTFQPFTAPSTFSVSSSSMSVGTIPSFSFSNYTMLPTNWMLSGSRSSVHSEHASYIEPLSKIPENMFSRTSLSSNSLQLDTVVFISLSVMSINEAGTFIGEIDSFLSSHSPLSDIGQAVRTQNNIFTTTTNITLSTEHSCTIGSHAGTTGWSGTSGIVSKQPSSTRSTKFTDRMTMSQTISLEILFPTLSRMSLITTYILSTSSEPETSLLATPRELITSHDILTVETVVETNLWESSTTLASESMVVLPGSTVVQSTEPSNRPPYLVKAVNQIIAEVGEYFEYEIDVHMFHDVEDGDTTHLALSLLFPFEQPLPKSFWLQLDAGTQVMYGLPLIRDAKNVTTVILTATDSGEASGKDAMQIMINDSILSRLTHKFIISFNLNFANFLSKRTNVIQLAYKIARYFGDANLDSLRVLDVEKGSLHLVWTNNSLLGSICKREEIMEIFGKMVFQNGSVVLEFEEYMEYQILSITYDLSGPCLLVPTVHPPKTTTEKIIYISDFNKWVEIVIPALAAILVLIIVVLIVFIVCRHRKPSETNILKSEKKTFMEDRKPIIFPDELEMDDSSLKPKRPLVLPGDSLKNQSALESDIRIRQNSASMDDVFVVDGRRNSPLPPPYNSDSLADPPPYRLPPPYLGKQGDAALHV